MVKCNQSPTSKHLHFTIRYLKNMLGNGTNAIKWDISNSFTSTFCDQQKRLVETALLKSRYNWCYDRLNAVEYL